MKVGIVGTGFMGSTHAAGWKKTDAEIVGFAAETQQEADHLAEGYGVKAYPTYKEMIVDVDVLDICTPTHLHTEMILLAAQAGKHIVCEKPLSRTFEGGLKAIRACNKAGVKIFVAHVVRYFPQYAVAKAAVDAGKVGKPGVIRLLRGSYRTKKPVGNWFLDESKSGGILMDLMIHDFDIARWIAGEVKTVYAKKVTTGHPDAEIDYGLVIMQHENGVLSHIAGAWAYPPPTFRTSIEITGSGGMIEYDSDATESVRDLLMQIEEEAPDVALPSSAVEESPYDLEIKDFYNAMISGSQPRVSPLDGLAAVQMAKAAVESSESGKAVQLKELPEVRS